MRLINCSMLTLYSIERSQANLYVILLHMWMDDEVLFENMLDLPIGKVREDGVRLK
jgi:hypothetical protein